MKNKILETIKIIYVSIYVVFLIFSFAFCIMALQGHIYADFLFKLIIMYILIHVFNPKLWENIINDKKENP